LLRQKPPRNDIEVVDFEFPDRYSITIRQLHPQIRRRDVDSREVFKAKIANR
jgi:hypothetical protein